MEENERDTRAIEATRSVGLPTRALCCALSWIIGVAIFIFLWAGVGFILMSLMSALSGVLMGVSHNKSEDF